MERRREAGVVLKKWFSAFRFWFQKGPSLLSSSPLKRALSLYQKEGDSVSPQLIFEVENQLNRSLPAGEKAHWETLKALIELKSLNQGSFRSPQDRLKEAFLLKSEKNRRQGAFIDNDEPLEFRLSEIAEAASSVARLYWKVLIASQDLENPFHKPAQKLLEGVSGRNFDLEKSPQYFDSLIDAIQQEGGIPFLVLNLVKRGSWSQAKPFAKKLLLSEIDIDEETRACLYWISEIHWFSRKGVTLSDFETTVRYLYHLCFTNPERAGFLEIDSHFFSQFDTINELAKEGFLFKETLIDRVFLLWESQSHLFDDVFKETLQLLTRQKSKIYEDRPSWQKWWLREKEGFDKEFLFLIESNLSYVAKDFTGALDFVRKALEISPHLRPALLNQVFCLAQLKDEVGHQKIVDELLEMRSLYPVVLSVIGNSYLLLGKDEDAKALYEELSVLEGWSQKAAYYQSTFCFENGLWAKALTFAQEAHEENPEDMTVSFHLSQCLSAVGRKQEALAILKSLKGVGPQWLNFYRFTLERDSGEWREALQTLSEIPLEYFDDPEELEAAVDFAKNSSDLNLLRRLKSRQ